jgi:hypothetical protein
MNSLTKGQNGSTSSPRYAGTDEEGEQNPTVAPLMAEDLLLSYIGDGEVTAVFNEVRGGYSP